MFAIKVETPNFPQETLFDFDIQNRSDVRYLNGTKARIIKLL
jgi:hypothetical protein